ncbi:hypothetical protein PoB_002295300 [Plakobranchus ocellatus]|uniref:Uncharacterized protein n=1 Tax=Plakobranchus ocellatus TaxID=259542 RepID=A0AAV3ZPF4_9GAST|nr:hypothetical protein PoB_002295300 [Plakobranchus ocellatus]
MTKISDDIENFKNEEKLRHYSQQGDLRLSGPPSGQGAGGGARNRDRRVPADLRAASQALVFDKYDVFLKDVNQGRQHMWIDDCQCHKRCSQVANPVILSTHARCIRFKRAFLS